MAVATALTFWTTSSSPSAFLVRPSTRTTPSIPSDAIPAASNINFRPIPAVVAIRPTPAIWGIPGIDARPSTTLSDTSRREFIGPIIALPTDLDMASSLNCKTFSGSSSMASSMSIFLSNSASICIRVVRLFLEKSFPNMDSMSDFWSGRRPLKDLRVAIRISDSASYPNRSAVSLEKANFSTPRTALVAFSPRALVFSSI